MDRCSYHRFINDKPKHVVYRLHIREINFDGDAGPGWTVMLTKKKNILTNLVSALKYECGVKRYNEKLNGLRQKPDIIIQISKKLLNWTGHAQKNEFKTINKKIPSGR